MMTAKPQNNSIINANNIHNNKIVKNKIIPKKNFINLKKTIISITR